jgi:predicted transposase/invertase (TIGR01784 family)
MAGHHDALFKSVFGQPEHALALVRPHLSDALRDHVDWSTMQLVPGSYVDEELRERHSDLVFRVASFAGPIYVYVLLEHQSTNDHAMTLRVLRYLERLWSRWQREHPHEPLPLIVPLVISNVPEGWSSPTRFSELFPLVLATTSEARRHIPDFEILVDDLCRSSRDALHSRMMAATAKLALWLLSARTDQRMRETMHEWLPLFVGLPFTTMELFTRYLARTLGSRVIWTEFCANLSQAAPEAAGVAMNLYEQWIAEGEAKGEAKGLVRGRAEGRAEGEASLLTKLLTTKFGPLPDAERNRLASATITELETWAERVLFATSLDQVFAP